jgi:hypothetical protein
VSLPRSGPLPCSSRVSDLALLQTCVFRARGLHLQIVNLVSFISPTCPDPGSLTPCSPPLRQELAAETIVPSARDAQPRRLLRSASCRSRGSGRDGSGTSQSGKEPCLVSVSCPAHNRAMNGISIYVDWSYFLGIVGTLIGIAYYANGRFTKIETTIEWLKETLLEIKLRLGDGTGSSQADPHLRDSSHHVPKKRHSRR